MDILVRHLIVIHILLWSLKDFAYADPLTISGETTVELNSKLSLDCSSLCDAEPRWEVSDNSMAKIEDKGRSRILTIDSIKPEDEMKYTCSVKCSDGHKKKYVNVMVYSIPRPVLYSTPQSPWSGQSFNMTCELKEFYPKDGIFKLHLFRNDTLIKDDMRNTNDNDKMTVTATDLQETTSTAHKCIAKLTLSNGTTKSTEANLLVQPREPKPTEGNVLPESITAKGRHRDSAAAEVLNGTEWPSIEVQTSSTSGGVHKSTALSVLSTLGAVASFMGLGSVLLLIQRRRKKRQQEGKEEDEEVMEKEKEKEQPLETST